MKLIKFLFFIFLVLLAWYVWDHYSKSKAPQSDVEVIDTGFTQVGWLRDAISNEVVVMGPT